MLRTISGDEGPRRAGARRRFPARRLHLVDIENLAGSSRPSLGQVRQAQGLYADCLAFGAMDQVEVASSHLTLLNAALGWPQARYRVRSGPDGADLALLDVLRPRTSPSGSPMWRSGLVMTCSPRRQRTSPPRTSG